MLLFRLETFTRVEPEDEVEEVEEEDEEEDDLLLLPLLLIVELEPLPPSLPLPPSPSSVRGSGGPSWTSVSPPLFEEARMRAGGRWKRNAVGWWAVGSVWNRFRRTGWSMTFTPPVMITWE
jgi:hypothetical protein